MMNVPQIKIQKHYVSNFPTAPLGWDWTMQPTKIIQINVEEARVTPIAVAAN